MRNDQLNIVMLGLSITSSWGNGHATTYRSLVKELTAAGHKVTFLERDMPWYAGNRDMPVPPFGITHIYNSVEELKDIYNREIKEADLTIVGSYVPDGIEVGEWVQSISRRTAFYDIDTPVTIKKLKEGNCEYLKPALIAGYNLYLSFTGGSILRYIERKYNSPMARPLYCSVDPDIYFPEKEQIKYDLGYIGTYSDDRQPVLEKLMLRPAIKMPESKFIVVGPMYPKDIRWPENIERIYHLSPREHRKFYNSQRFTLNITRAEMVKAGYSPSVRLFEAAACGIPIISDYWNGIETFFEPDKEILISHSAEDTIFYLKDLKEKQLRDIGTRARNKILNKHTARHRAYDLIGYFYESAEQNKRRRNIYA